MINCSQLRSILREIKTLKQEFDMLLKIVNISDDIDDLKVLRKKVNDKIEEIDDAFYFKKYEHHQRETIGGYTEIAEEKFSRVQVLRVLHEIILNNGGYPEDYNINSEGYDLNGNILYISLIDVGYHNNEYRHITFKAAKASSFHLSEVVGEIIIIQKDPDGSREYSQDICLADFKDGVWRYYKQL
jgi:hypothetical protein